MSTRSSPSKQTLPSGLTVYLNDHVFVAAPYDDRGGDPYNIGRIQEFFPQSQELRVNFYVRPRDIGTRMALHGRRLLATMHSDVVPVHFVRGLCTVLHRDNIPNQDEDKYRRQPDCFYFNQYYDRYLHRYFDVVPVERIRNAPDHVLRFLLEHFTYILCENSYVNDLCDELDSCELCHKSAAPVNSVSCEICSKHFHLQCLNPPLPAKPKKGFGFTCAPCFHRQEQEYEEYLEGKRDTPPTTAKSSKSKGKAKAVPGSTATTPITPATQAPGQMRLLNGWPWRYYGVHTLPEDVLDPHESLYPRAASRLGPKYQTVVLEDKFAPIPSTSRFKNPPIARGEDSEVEVVFKPPPAAEDPKLDEYMEKVKGLPLHGSAGVNLQSAALSRWHADPATAWDMVCKLKKRDFRLTNWSPADCAWLESLAQEVGDDLVEVHKLIPQKTMAELVNYVYTKLPEVNNRVDTKHDQDKFAGAVVTGIASTRDAEEVAEADLETESRAATPPPRSKKRLGPCSVCESKISSSWYRCPGQTGAFWSQKEKILCDSCSVQWRHYANDHVFVEDTRNRNRSAKAKPKPTAATPTDAAALSSMLSPQSSLTPEPPEPPKPTLPYKPCVLCKRHDPKTTLAQCQRCSITCHTLCAALDPDTVLDEWLCELCTEVCRPKPKPTVMASTETPAQFRARGWPLPERISCALCPDVSNQPPNLDKPSLSAVDLFRRTEFSNFLHYICAVWHPEVKFSKFLEPSTAEGICDIPMSRRLQECCFCHKKDVGAYVQCADCDVWFHVGCAWTAHCRFGFEIVVAPPQRKRDKEAPTTMKFKDSAGLMLPSIWCKAHKVDEVRHIDRSTFELGEKDPECRLTTIMAYLKNYKKASPSTDPPLLAKSKRIDSWIWPALEKDSADDPMAPRQTRGVRKLLTAVPQPPPSTKPRPHTSSASASKASSARTARPPPPPEHLTTSAKRERAASKRASRASARATKKAQTHGEAAAGEPEEGQQPTAEEPTTPKLTIKLQKPASAEGTRLEHEPMGPPDQSDWSDEASEPPAKRHKSNGHAAETESPRHLKINSDHSATLSAECAVGPEAFDPTDGIALNGTTNGTEEKLNHLRTSIY